jgi:hypothetical protein
MTRVVIAGWPKSGKSYAAAELGKSMGVEPKSTDSLIYTLSWTEVSSRVADWFDEPGPWIIEGVAVMRALRKWHLRHEDEAPPFDQLFILPAPKISDLTPGQISMGKGIDTVFNQIEQWLGSRYDAN